MFYLAKLLGEDPKKSFLSQHFTKLPFSRPGGANDFLHFLNWKVVEKIFKENKSVLRIVQDGRVIKDYVDLSFDEARNHHGQGHTLLLRYAEKSSPELKDLALDFENGFHTPVDIQLYCTPEGHNAFGWHYDVEEVFILQTKGSKSYSIRPNTVHPMPLISSIPKDLNYELEKTPIGIKVTLEEGDFLYIPSGWWHIARTEKESMHISIGLMPSSAVDLASFLPQYLSKNHFWRTRMPVHLEFNTREDEISFYQEAMGTLGKDLSKIMSSAEFIRSFLEWKKSSKQD